LLVSNHIRYILVKLGQIGSFPAVGVKITMKKIETTTSLFNPPHNFNPFLMGSGVSGFEHLPGVEMPQMWWSLVILIEKPRFFFVSPKKLKEHFQDGPLLLLRVQKSCTS